MKFKQEFLDKFISVAIERHRVYIQKEMKLPKPWSEDPIFQNYFFCNVFRQYDKCTKWIIENVIPMVNQDWENWTLIILYRYISTYDIFKEIENTGKINDIPWIKNYLKEKRAIGDSMFNGCFLRNPRIKGGWVKTWEVPFYLIDEIRENGKLKYIIESTQSLEELTKWFTQFSATKGFMGYEYSCDLEYTKWLNPIDKYSWCNKGPGAQKGLSWLVYGNDHTKFSDQEFLEKCQELFIIMKKGFRKFFPQEIYSMREVEHWLCEFQKYIKYLSNYQSGFKCKYRKYQGY